MSDAAGADLEEVLDHLSAMIEDARALPMSASCVVNRAEVLDLVDEARRVLPAELAEARRVLAERDRLLEQSRAQAERLVEQAREQAERLVEQGREEQGQLVEATAVYTRAQAEADRLLEQATSDAEAMRLQTEDYVDGKLASFEAVLSTTLSTVQRGRDRLSGRAELDGDSRGDHDRAAAPHP